MTIGSILILRKMMESASACEFTTIAGPTSQDKRPMKGAQNTLNLRKVKRKLKRIYPKQGD
jgi:hypothetical protein